jgi:pyrroloquinoline-quinone synthase
MSIKETLDVAVAKRNLLEHPFYQAWSAGTLPVDALRTYAREYGASAAHLFSDPAAAAGALYAFEVQQPATAQSKLAGLKTHYNLPSGVEPYFEIHSHNEHEARKLVARIDAFSSDEQARAVQACSEMAESLWTALTGIYDSDKMIDN